MGGYGCAHGVLDEIVFGEQAVSDVRHYVQTRTGRRFERLDDTGERSEDADTFTPADVVATIALSLPWRGVIAMECVTSRVDLLNALLSQVPHTPMHLARESDYDSDGPADRVWQALTEIDGINAAMAGKLLARKRPHHVPVYDRVVVGVLRHPEDFWLCLHSWFTADPARVAGVAQLRDRSGLCPESSLLRCVDIALWMHGKRVGLTRPEPRVPVGDLG